MTVAVSATDVGVTVRNAELLAGVDLEIAVGEWVSIIGPNGAGKSTLLRALSGVGASSGRIELCGKAIGGLSPRERARLVSWVPQTPTIPTGIAVFDYVLLGRSPHLHPLSRERAIDIEIATAAIEELDLAPMAQRMVDTLSGGELQRAVIARAVAQESPVLLLDEPTAALDLGHQQEVLSLLDRLRSGGERTVITTMHDLSLAGAYADRLLLLNGGQVVAQGTSVEVLTQANIEQYYRARVHIRHEGGRVTVTPELGSAPG